MELEQQLRVALAPAKPAPRVRAAVMARLAAEPASRFPQRWVYVGVALALGAAAAMLTIRWWNSPARAMVANAVAEVVPPPARPVDDVSPEPAAEPASAETANASGPTSPKAKPFTVQVMPLQSDVADPARKAAIESVYDLLVSGLWSVPNATILVTPAIGDVTPATPDYRLALTGTAGSTIEPDGYVVELKSTWFRAGGREGGSMYFGTSADASPGCTTPPSTDVLANLPACTDPAGVAAGLLSTLRKRVFPPDPLLQRRLEERLADSKLESADRLRALVDLGSLGKSSGLVAARDFAPGLRDPGVVRAAIQLASSAPDPEIRAQVWNTLRGSTDSQLVSPLAMALRSDLDDDTRVQALATLAEGFAADASARAALEVAAAEDPKPMVRALAKRGLGVESAWTEHVLSSLKNSELPAQERIEAFFYAYGLQTTRTYGTYSADGRILRALDDAAIRALAEVIPKAARESTGYRRASFTLMSEFAQLKHPAITDLLLSELTASDAWYDPSWAVEGLRSRVDDVRVRAALQKVADESPQPQLKSLAASILSGVPRVLPGDRPGVVTATTAVPPRLGVGSDYVKAAQDVPAELVGKLVITHIATGGPAHQAGIKEGDILLEVGGKPITSGPQLLEVLEVQPRNEDVDVLISRERQLVRLAVRF